MGLGSASVRRARHAIISLRGEWERRGRRRRPTPDMEASASSWKRTEGRHSETATLQPCSWSKAGVLRPCEAFLHSHTHTHKKNNPSIYALSFSPSGKAASFLSIQSRFCFYQQVASAARRSGEVSGDVYCERVNRLCCGFRDRDPCHINPPLCGRAEPVTTANGSKITRLSLRHIGLIIMFYFLLL